MVPASSVEARIEEVIGYLGRLADSSGPGGEELLGGWRGKVNTHRAVATLRARPQPGRRSLGSTEVCGDAQSVLCGFKGTIC